MDHEVQNGVDSESEQAKAAERVSPLPVPKEPCSRCKEQEAQAECAPDAPTAEVGLEFGGKGFVPDRPIDDGRHDLDRQQRQQEHPVAQDHHGEERATRVPLIPLSTEAQQERQEHKRRQKNRCQEANNCFGQAHARSSEPKSYRVRSVPTILLAVAIAAWIPFLAFTALTRAFCVGFSCRM